ncbi:MAG: hypothetical protein ACXAEU_17815 [Candidatus Hodarchaeales archaeon]|jgi:hypothetical protein
MTWRRSRQDDNEQDRGFSLKDKILARAQDTTTAEEIAYQVWSWWLLLVMTLIIGVFIIMFSLTNPKFILVGLLTLLAMPVIAIYCLIMLIPEIKIFGFTIFNPRKYSYRKQLSVGRTVAKAMTREFFRQSPEVAFILFAFVAIFIISIILALM